MASLDSSREKLRWANEHFEALEHEVLAYFSGGNHTVVHERDPTSGYHRLKLTVPEPLPRNWPLVIGDCAHNARAALDQLAWQFAGADPADTATQFPIFSDPAKFNPRQIHALPRRAAALVKWLQPYRRTHPRHDRLWSLYMLDNEDKHKTVSIALAALGGFDLTPHIPPYSRLIHRLEVVVGPFEPPIQDAVFAEGPFIAYPLDGSPPNTNVEVDIEPSFDIAIRAETMGTTFIPGLAVLREVLDCVEQVLALFERL